MYIYGDIVSEQWFDSEVAPQEVVDLLNEMAAMQVSDIDVYVNSPGGSVFAGMAIYSALKKHPANVTVQVDGLAASIASVIAMAGDMIVMSDVGMMMIHSPWSASVGNAEEFRKQADVLDKVQEAMINAYARTNLSEKRLNDMLSEETWMTAKDAVTMGFADEIVEGQDVAAKALPKLAPGRFRNTPESLLQPQNSVAPPVRKEEADPMPDEDIEKKIAAAQKTALEQARAEERERKDGIKTLFAKFPQHAELKTECIEDSDCTLDQANEKLLEKLAEGQEPLGGASRIEVTEDERDKFRAGVVDGILQRGMVNKRDDSNHYRGFSMRDVARACVARMGQPVDKMSTEQIIKASLSSESDFPVLYEEAMHKTLLQAYRVIPDTWSTFMASGTLSDFRPHNRYRMGTFGNLPGLEENGEIKMTSLDDATKEQIQATERGMRFSLSFKMIVDDDLGGLLNIARQMGRSARRTVESTAYDELLANPVMNDGTALFHANHGNLAASGAEISVASLGAARAAMRRQMDPSSNEYIDLLPSTLLCPVELGDLARQVIMSETDFSQANSRTRNPIQNMVNVVDTPRLTGTAWYLFVSPSDTAIGEVGFLNGASEPDVRMEELFATRGIQYRVTLDFGVAMLEWRAGYMNPGA